MANDYELGMQIGKKLLDAGIETPMVLSNDNRSKLEWVTTRPNVSNRLREILQELGLDLQNDSLKDTPKRVSKMYVEEVFYGLNYANFPACTTVENKNMVIDEVVIVKDNDVLSMCEHHLVPFIGRAHVAYIPQTKILGLSKFNRVVDFFSRRPQVQERLTSQIHMALCHILGTEDVAIIIEASHLCVKLRGVKQANSSTITSKNSGRFRENPALRAELFALIGK